ncbi:MAG: molybdate ABC transporter substrate-binding protein [Deltaproteobacteria bacterium]|jgi:molybdate transport system substrate-binding protein|nr:molybdate ABC transporter substrate-binding protein [Deltaproteobacteria bacterium]
MIRLFISLFISIFTLILPVTQARSEDFQVAVAANFTNAATDIAAAFEKETGDKPVLSFGSTGNFKTQIENGAPFMALLAADDTTPMALEKDGYGVEGTRFTYAQGVLVLWSATEGYLDDKASVLVDKKFKFLAVANPDLAPYGFAGFEFLKKLKLVPGIESKIVTGNNITDTFNSAKSGNADLGLIAWSQVCKGNKLTEGSVYQVPPEDYTPIRQDAVLLKAGADSKPTKAFLEYLTTDTAKEIIKNYCYTLP